VKSGPTKTPKHTSHGAKVTDLAQFEQFKLIYDYIKFHIGLYLATSPIIANVAESFDVKTRLLSE
jgi:hypothetical protein